MENKAIEQVLRDIWSARHKTPFYTKLCRTSKIPRCGELVIWGRQPQKGYWRSNNSITTQPTVSILLVNMTSRDRQFVNYSAGSTDQLSRLHSSNPGNNHVTHRVSRRVSNDTPFTGSDKPITANSQCSGFASGQSQSF